MATARDATKFRRPLQAAHWSLPATLIAAWLMAAFSFPCSRGPHYLGTSLLVASVCIVLWCNHLGKAPLHSRAQVLAFLRGSAYDLLALLAFFVVASLPFGIFLPAYQCYTDRARVSEVLAIISKFRTEIEARALKAGTVRGVGRSVVFLPEGRARAGVVSEDGVVLVVGEDPPVVLMLSPSLVNGEISWKCIGFPEKVVPMSCRGNAT